MGGGRAGLPGMVGGGRARGDWEVPGGVEEEGIGRGARWGGWRRGLGGVPGGVGGGGVPGQVGWEDRGARPVGGLP